MQLLPEALDYSETKKALRLDHPKQTKILENVQIVPSKENLRTHANEMPVHSVPGLLPPGTFLGGGGELGEAGSPSGTQSIFSPLNNARDNLCVSILWKQMIKKDYQRKRRKSDLGPRSLRS